MSKKLTTDEFVEKAKKVHGDKYDYSKVNYINSQTKVCIICPEHGEFWQFSSNHFKGHGCPMCSNVHNYTTEEFIQKAVKKHGYKYDYSKVEYVNAYTKVCIVCPEHGEFWQTPHSHITKHGCIKCGNILIGNKLRKEKDLFIEKAREIHGDRYDYTKVEYKSARSKVCIICAKHGDFFTTPDSHLHSRSGCPKCNQSKLELEVSNYLINNNIKFEYQKKFDWLKNKLQLSLDFYLPDYNVAIECQGEQHYRPISFGNLNDANERFDLQIKRDEIKINECKRHHIRLVHIKYNDNVIEHLKYELKGASTNV